MFQRRVYKLQTEKLISATEWPKQFLQLVEVAYYNLGTGFSLKRVGCTTIKKIDFFLVENNKIDFFFQMLTKNSFQEPISH